MRRKRLSYFEDVSSSDALDADAPWPELRSALRESADCQDLGLWRLAEHSARWARRRPGLLRLVPPLPPPSPDFPDAA